MSPHRGRVVPPGGHINSYLLLSSPCPPALVGMWCIKMSMCFLSSWWSILPNSGGTVKREGEWRSRRIDSRFSDTDWLAN